MLRVSRRNILASSAAVAAIATGTGCAEALIQRRPGSHGLTTITLVNTGAGTLNAGSVTQLIGCPFKKGDIVKGTWPQFQLRDGTSVPCTILEKLATTWSDGSLKFVPVMLSVPKRVSGNGTLEVDVLSGGGMPLPSPRKLSDFHQADIHPRVEVDGMDHLAGTWVMALRHAIKSRTKIVPYGNGAAGAVWKVRANARRNGADHGQLVCDFYIASLANPDGSLKGLRILGKVKLPYYDSNATMNWMSFSRFQLCLDRQGTLIRDCFGSDATGWNFGPKRSYTFTWASGSTFNADAGYSQANNGDYAYCTRLTTTGTLPAGLSPKTSYFIAPLSSTQVGFGQNSSYPFNSLVAATDSGSGTHTATPYPYLTYFGALFTAGPTGMWDFVQGAGTDSSDTALRFQIDKSYWVSTGLIPSYDINLEADSNAATSYWPNSSEPVMRGLNTTGDRDDIGPLPAWYVRHFLTQAAVDEQVVRVVSLVGGHGFATGVENSATLSLPAVNNGPDGKGTSYKGMATPNPIFWWEPGLDVRAVGFNDTTDQLVQLAGFSQQDTAHMCQFNYYPYLFTGEPWHLDMLLEHANNGVIGRLPGEGVASISKAYYALSAQNIYGGYRNVSVGANPARYGVTIGCATGQERTDAWASMLLAAAASIGPDRNPDCVSYKKYFNDMNQATWNAAADIINALPPVAAKWGLWDIQFCNGGPGSATLETWEMGYLGAVVAFAATATENAHAFKALQATAKFFSAVFTAFGGWHMGTYLTNAKMGDQYGSSLVTDENHITFFGPTVNWTAGGTFTFNPFSNYMARNGDTYMFIDTGIVPAGFKNFKPYYMVELDGTAFGLSATNGGDPIQLTDSYNSNNQMFIIASHPPKTGSMAAIGGPGAYNSILLGILNYADAAGATVLPELTNDLGYRNRHAGTNYAPDPRWKMTTTFYQKNPK
jgi:hypothetical protein